MRKPTKYPSPLANPRTRKRLLREAREEGGELPRSVAAYLYTFGRPRKYTDPNAMWNAAVAHMELCARHNEPLTFHGIVLALGFVDNDALSDYAKLSPDFRGVVRAIRQAVADGYERDLRSKFMVGSIFAMKNVAGWSDRQDVELRGVVAGVNLDRLSDAHLQRVRSGEHPLAILAEIATPTSLASPTPLALPLPTQDTGDTPPAFPSVSQDVTHVPQGGKRRTKRVSADVANIVRVRERKR